MQTQYKKFLTQALWVAIVVVAIRCLISWDDIIANPNAYDLYGYASEAVAVTGLLMMMYEKWLWRWIPLKSVPALKKKYTGILKSSYDDCEHNATIEIKQTLLYVRVTVITKESKSQSLSASIIEEHGEKQLVYTYLNIPKSEFRHRSEIQYGTAVLCIDNPKELIGRYYTDRKTIGDMKFTPSTK